MNFPTRKVKKAKPDNYLQNRQSFVKQSIICNGQEICNSSKYRLQMKSLLDF